MIGLISDGLFRLLVCVNPDRGNADK